MVLLRGSFNRQRGKRPCNVREVALMGDVDIRVMGDSDDVIRFIEEMGARLGKSLMDVSQWYPNRRGSAAIGRVYCRVRM